MASVFISYSHKDAHLAKLVHKRLSDAGHEVWRDAGDDEPDQSSPEGIATGLSIPEGIANGLERCDASARMQLFFQYDSHLWDQVAGIVLVRNSKGGSVSKLPDGRGASEVLGENWTFSTRDFIAAANPNVCYGSSRGEQFHK
jgi:hypothetical protein